MGNGLTSGVLFQCTDVCGALVKVYQLFPCFRVSGLIRGVNFDLTDDDIAQHLRVTSAAPVVEACMPPN